VNTILYLSYGQGPHEQEVIFSIHTALKWITDKPAIRVVVCTDHPESFCGVPVNIQFISPQQWSDWSGPTEFNHRRKIMALQHVMEKSASKVILLDGDTYLRGPVEQLFERVAPGCSLLHLREGTLESIKTPNMKRLRDLIAKAIVSDLRGVPYPIVSTECIWNAGVIGMDPSDRHLLDDVLHLTDQLCAQSDLHVLEQFAFSHVLLKYTQVNFAEDIIFHYWPPYLHRPFRSKLPQIFAKAEQLPPQERTNYLYSCRPRPTLARRGKVIIKRLGQTLGLFQGAGRSNEW
jgi:hypothetical protein